MSTVQKHILAVGLILAVFAIGATSLVVFTEAQTRDKISDNERQTLLLAINALVTSDDYDNDILSDTLLLPATSELATTKPTTVYRARQGNNDIAVVFTSIAPNGYSGKITLLVGVYADGTLAGVRVISHKETPGLGDKIDARKGDWILKFKGLSLNNPTSAYWKVKKDGGDFDQFTGATITPRAVVLAIKSSLLYFNQHQHDLFKRAE